MADALLVQLREKRDELQGELRKYETAITALEGSGGKRGRGPGRPKGSTKAKASSGGRGKAVSKAELKEMLVSGMTGAAIAARLGVSMPTVHNYKKKFGLTSPRGGKTARKKSAKRVVKKRGAKTKAG